MTERRWSGSVQLKAERSLLENNLNQFIKALANEADVNGKMSKFPYSKYSLFEMACKTPGRAKFIAACLQRGAYVTQIDSNNWKHVFECAKLLLKYDANINATDKYSVSPIALLVTALYDGWRKEILEYCLQNYSVNVDYRGQQARKAIVKNFPGTDIPIYDMEKVTVDVLRNKLNVETEDEFLAAYEKYCQQNNGHVPTEEERAELLSVAVYRAKLTAAQKLVEGQIVEGKFTGNPKLLSGLLAKCCNRGNEQMLEWLLQIIPDDEVALVNKDPLLSLLVKKIDVYKDKKESSYIRSMRILLNDPRLDIDKIDVKKCTAMHYAVKYKNDYAQELLLDEGAYIWGENIFGDLPISEMDSSLLEKHLDSCVTNNDRKPGDEDYEVRISFANFIPPAHNPNSEDEMRPIVHIAQSPNSKHLLWHPVISSILLLKWISFLLAHESADETWSMVLVGVLLLLGVELTLQFGMLPINSIATNMVMLKTVTKNFLTSLSLYSIILASFTLSFYTVCKMKDIAQLRESNRPVQAAVHNQDIEDEHLFHNFGEIQLALMKTTVMFTGKYTVEL
ncbi:transient receptor potential cation channel protein painless-like [Anopheles arabiensis]|uniref:transient receptor potential cation channel protein painless-like n=1 Tax=Anopheles arabiensis TaxID=7173 RepID=UPI001AAD742E|nr:transient receptor potential cation channel protein painless-like [Anopheles arabiensis]